MINNISNMSNSMLTMRSSGMKGPPPPQGQDVFQVADTNGDGVVSLSELEAVTEGIEEVTGTTINVDEALSSYDANQDGGLSGEELLLMMTGNGFAPPKMAEGEETDFGMQPPPPPMEQAASAYEQSSNNDQIAQLIELLQSKDSDEAYVSIDITS
ncbi:MAG: hypothetical protein KKE53_15655 [Proteobacteria bacterium]|nr:hypothetical protein [Pseudomonadota bacterium]